MTITDDMTELANDIAKVIKSDKHKHNACGMVIAALEMLKLDIFLNEDIVIIDGKSLVEVKGRTNKLKVNKK